MHVLVVEDDPGVTAALTVGLRWAAHLVEVAADGQLALARLREAPPPELALVDLTLPGIGGRELIETMAADERLRAIPVIMMTASRRVELYPRPGTYQSFLHKPFGLDQVLDAIAAASARC